MSTLGTATEAASGVCVVTDGGMETDLIFHHGVDLPEFAAFVLLDSVVGRRQLIDYYRDYIAIARRSGAGLLLETPTWRASPEWGDRLGYGADDLRRINVAAVELLASVREQQAADLGSVKVVGMIGPRGDGYSAEKRMSPDEAARYHRPQMQAFVEAGADSATAYTLTHPGEAIGIIRAARAVGLPIAVSFTVETDGRLPGGETLAAAVAAVDAVARPEHFLINCAHPDHIRAGLDGGAWVRRIAGLRMNASRKSHAELDEATEIDEGDPAELVAATAELAAGLPGLRILGGCCGTDSRHVAALWDAVRSGQMGWSS